MVALLIRGGKVVNFGVNQLRYSRGLSYFKQSLHAEIDLIKKSKSTDIVGAKVYIYRFNNTTAPDAREPKTSEPCLLCQHMLNRAMVGKVTFIDKNNNLASVRSKDFHQLTDHPCQITKIFAEQQRANSEVRFEPQQYIAF